MTTAKNAGARAAAKANIGAWAKVGLLCAGLAMTACAPIVERHGYVPSQADLAQIVPGRTTISEVLTLLPAPTVRSPRANGGLYYVYSEFRTLGPLPRNEVDRKVLAIDANGAGVVTGVTQYGLRDGRVVPLVQDVTDDNLPNVSFLRQLMGNFGRVDASQILGQ